MKSVNLLAGFILVIFGALIGYLDVLIVNTFYSVSLWVSDILNAPESLTILIILALVLFFISIILFIALLSIYVIVVGIALIFSD